MSSTSTSTSTSSPTNTPPARPRASGRELFSIYWSRYSAIVILALLVVIFSALEPSFIGGNNALRIGEQSTITILLAFGEFFAILLAGIDLSVGAVMALVGIITAQLAVAGTPWPVAVVLGVLAGLVLGVINGALVAITKLHPFIITLGTMSIYRGLTYVVSDATPVSGLPTGLVSVVGGRLFGVVPVSVIIVLFCLAVLMFFTTRTRAGRNLYAMGGNPISAWFAGINSVRHTILAFAISGTMAGLAGIVNISRLGAAEPNAGTGYETFAIAAVIIAGTSFFGGEGVIWKVLIGGLIIGTINNGLNMVGVSSFYQQIAMGVLIVLAVTLDRYFGPRSAGRR